MYPSPVLGKGIRRRLIIATFVVLDLLLLAPWIAVAASAAPAATSGQGGLLVYHQITDRPEGSGGIDSPVLSADGRRAAFGDYHPSPDRAAFGWNRIHVISADGTGLTEVDAYQTPCSCEAMIDLSADGATVVSSDGFRLRIAAKGYAWELFYLMNGSISAVRITADGQRIVFVVDQDGYLLNAGLDLARGVWAIDVDGNNLRHLAGAEEIAAALGVSIEETQVEQVGSVRCCFQYFAEVGTLDISDDGGRVVFGAHAAGKEYVFAVDGEGGVPLPLLGPVDHVNRVAIGSDGTTIAYDIVPLDNTSYGYKEVGIVGTDGEFRLLTTSAGWDHADRLQLSTNGAELFIGGSGLLIDTGTGAVREIGVPVTILGVPDEPPTNALPAATMNAAATRFLFTMNAYCLASRCPTQQLALLDLDSTAPGNDSAIAVA